MKATTELIRKLESAGCEVTRTRGRHIRVVTPRGRTRFTSATPSDHRAYKNFVATLRREGVDI